MLDTPIENLYILISRKANGNIKPMYVHSFSPKALSCPDDNAPACEKLKFIRLQKGLTQAEATRIIGIDRSTYIRWEKGEAKSSWDKLARAAEVLNNIKGHMWLMT